MMEFMRYLFSGGFSALLSLFNAIATMTNDHKRDERDKKVAKAAVNEAELNQRKLDDETDSHIADDTVYGELRKRIRESITRRKSAEGKVR